MSYTRQKEQQYTRKRVWERGEGDVEIRHEVPKAELESTELERTGYEERIELRFKGKKKSKINIPTREKIISDDLKLNEEILKRYREGKNYNCHYSVLFRRLKEYPERFFELPVVALSSKEAIEKAKMRIVDVLFDCMVHQDGEGVSNTGRYQYAKKNKYMVPLDPKEKEDLMTRKSGRISALGA